MSKKTPKYLIETSAIPPALGTTTLAYVRYFDEVVRGGSLFSSIYIRKEFIRRWICDSIRIVLTLNQCSSWADALVHLEQDFGRKPKGTLDVVQHFLRQTGTINNHATAVEEVATLTWTWLKRFDRRFQSRINNKCKCKLGGRELKIDGNHLLEDLFAFYMDFQKPVTDCEVDGFLELANENSDARRLLRDGKASKCEAVKNLQALADAAVHVTCKECATIGDAVIGLEQPGSWNLVHVDKAFNAICESVRKDHIHIKSLKGLEKIDLNPDKSDET